MRHGCGLTAEDLGPYALGQLGPVERSRVDGLLAGCPSCSAEVARLQPVGAALLAHAAPGPAPALVLDRALDAVHAAAHAAARRRRRRALLAVAAAVLLPVVLAGLLLAGRPAPGQHVALTGSGGTGGHVRVEDRSWGSALTLDVHGLTPGRTYGAWLADGASRRVPAGTFRVTRSGAAHLDLSAALDVGDTRTVGVTEIGGKDVLLGRVAARS